MAQISRTDIFLDFGSIGEQEVRVLYVYTPGAPQIISDHWGGVPEEPPFVEILAVQLFGKEIAEMLEDSAFDTLVEEILHLEASK